MEKRWFATCGSRLSAAHIRCKNLHEFHGWGSSSKCCYRPSAANILLKSLQPSQNWVALFRGVLSSAPRTFVSKLRPSYTDGEAVLDMYEPP
eukprot:6354373-Pyramimonas_sp.AAC.1